MAIKQRFTYFFAGDSLDTDVWDVTTTGSSTQAMEDAVNGGLIITTGASTDDRIELDFADKRQYDFNATQVLGTMKTNQTTDCAMRLGLMDATLTSEVDHAWLGYDTGLVATNYILSTKNTTEENTSCGVVADTSYHNFKIILGASNITGYIDNILRATNSTQLPDAKMQPHISGQTRTTSSKTFNYLNYEAFNT